MFCHRLWSAFSGVCRFSTDQSRLITGLSVDGIYSGSRDAFSVQSVTLRQTAQFPAWCDRLCWECHYKYWQQTAQFSHLILPDQQKNELPDHQEASGHGPSSSSGQNIALLRPDEEAKPDQPWWLFGQIVASTTMTLGRRWRLSTTWTRPRSSMTTSAPTATNFTTP